MNKYDVTVQFKLKSGDLTATRTYTVDAQTKEGAERGTEQMVESLGLKVLSTNACERP